MNKPLFKEDDFPLESKVLYFLSENFSGREITVRRKEIENAIGEKLTSQKVSFLIQALKKFGVIVTSKILSSHKNDEELTFVITKPNTEELSKAWQTIQEKKTATPIIIA